MPFSPRLSFAIGLACAAAASAGGCGNESSLTPEEQARLTVKSYIDVELNNLVAASTALAAAAPAPDADGWNAATDAAAVAAMKTEWKKARVAYERVEGAIAVLFPDLDTSTDERYDGFIEAAPDTNLFDDQIVTGVHAIERILWADQHPPQVKAFEEALTNYRPPAFPATEAEARAFKEELAALLVTDATKMKNDFAPLALDNATAYRGVIGSMAEQLEKVMLASTGEDESRYSQHTLADMRANLEGGEKTYLAFAPWVKTKTGGAALDTEITAGFARVKAEYSAVQGDALPPVPPGFNPTTPAPADLGMPYGKIFALLGMESDTKSLTSLVTKMDEAGNMLGIPRLPDE